MTFYGKSENGALKLAHQKEYEDLIKNLEGKKVELTLEEARSERTLAQNRLYFSIYLGTISEHTGDDKNSLHAFFKQMFLSNAVILKNGEWVKIIGSTTKLKTNQFSDYLARIHAWAMENLENFVLPTESDYLNSFTLESEQEKSTKSNPR